MTSKSVKRFKQGHECDIRTTDRQIDHDTVKYVEKMLEKNEIACAAKAISPNNNNCHTSIAPLGCVFTGVVGRSRKFQLHG